MANDRSSDNGQHVWGPGHQDAGIKLVVAVVDDATAALLRQAAGAGDPHGWGDPQRSVAEPGPGGIARVMTSSLYQDLVAFPSDLMIFDPAVADEEAWDVLCDYFSACRPAQERVLLLRPLPLPEVPDENVTIIVAPAELTAELLREGILDAPIR